MSSKVKLHQNMEKQHNKKRKRSVISEKEVSRAEALLLDSNRQPETKEDFEKMVFQSPLSSLAWLGYAAFHLGRGEVEAARAVMERALNKIPFDEEKEIRNIWFSYVNLECTYGGSSSLDAILKRFMQHNDKFEALEHLLKTFERCQKLQEAEDIAKKIMKKFKHLSEAWTAYGNFLYSTGKAEDARKLLKEIAKFLQKDQQITVTVNFAKAEFRIGSSQEGIMLFENLIATYPTRTDIWSVYIDAVAKVGEKTDTMELYERALLLKLPEKKMNFLRKKYQDFKNVSINFS